jgi:hypothetical protein
MKSPWTDKKLVMPERRPQDGRVSVWRPNEGEVTISVTNAGVETFIAMSDHNAWQVFGLLAVMLGIPLPKRLGNLIKF